MEVYKKYEIVFFDVVFDRQCDEDKLVHLVYVGIFWAANCQYANCIAIVLS